MSSLISVRRGSSPGWWRSLVLVPLVALVAALLPVSNAAGATVTSVFPVLTTTAAQATGVTYTVAFTTSSTGGLEGGAGTITLSAASGTQFPSAACDYSVADTTANTVTTSCPTGITTSGGGDTATFTLPSGYSVQTGDALTVTVKGVTNPGTGSDAISIATSADTTPASAPAISITAAQPVANATVNMSSLVGGETNVTYTIGWDNSSTGGLVGGAGTVTIGAAAGTSFPTSACAYEVTDVTTGKTANCVTALQTGTNGNTASFTLPSAVSPAAGDNVNVVVSGITNPAATTEALTVVTSSDSVQATTQQVVLSGDPGLTSSVTDVSAALSTLAEGAVGANYTITFQASSDGGLPAGGPITVVAPVGTRFDGGGQCDEVADVTTGTKSGGCNQTSFAGDGSIMTVYSGVAVNAGDDVSISASDVSNPEVATTVVSVSTVSDGIFAASPSVGLAAPVAVSGLQLASSTAAAGASEVTDTFTFSASSNGALEGSLGTIDLEGTSGMSFPSGGNCDYDLTDVTTGANACAGLASRAGSSSSSAVTVVIPSNVTIAAGDAVQLVVAQATNPASTSDAISLSTSSDLVPASASVPLVTPSAVALGKPSLTITPSVAGADGATVVTSFATSSSSGALVASDGDVTLTGPAGTVFPQNRCDYQVDDVKTQSSNCAVGVVVGGADGGSSVAVTVPIAIRASDDVKLTITNVQNPGTPSADFTITTSSDTTAVTTSTVALTAPQAVSITAASVSPAVTSAGGVTDTVSFKASSTGDLQGGTSWITLGGSPGSSFPSSGCDYQVYDVTTSSSSGCMAGVSLAGTEAELDLPSGFTVNAGNIVTITVDYAGNPPSSAEDFTVSTSSDLIPASATPVALDAGTSVTGPALSVATPVQHAAADTDTITFHAANPIGSTAYNGVGAIVLEATPGTLLPTNGCDYALTDVTTSTPVNCLNVNVSPSGSTVSISMPQIEIRAGDAVSVVISNVTEPATGTANVSIATSSDLVPVSASAVSLAAAKAPTDVSLSLSSSAGGASATYTVGFTASDEGSVPVNASVGVLVVGAPGTLWPQNGCDYTWDDVTTDHSTNCINAGMAGSALQIQPPFQVNPGDQIKIVASGATNPATASQQVHLLTATDSLIASSPTVALTGETAPTSVTALSLTLSEPVSVAMGETATIGWTETGAAPSGESGTVTLSGTGLADGNGCDYELTDVTSGQSSSLCGASVMGPAGNVLAFSTGLPIAAGDQLQIAVPIVDNGSGSASVSLATSTDPAVATSSAETLSAPQPVTSTSLSLSSAVAGRPDTTWTVGFTASSTGLLVAGQPWITIELPPGTGLSGNGCSVTLTDVTTQHSSGNCVNLNESWDGEQANVQVPGFTIHAGDQVQVALANVENPPGSQASVKVSTFSDLVPATSNTVALTTGAAVSSPTASLSSAADSAASVTGTFNFTTSAGGALGGANDAITIAGSQGVSFPGNGCDYTVTDVTNGHSHNCVSSLALAAGGSSASFSPPGGLAIAGGDTVEVTVSAMRNPGNGENGNGAGSVVFDISTTADSLPVSTPALTLAAASAPATPSVTVSDDAEGAGSISYAVDFQASAAGELEPSGAVTLSAAPGTEWPGDGCDYTVVDTTTGHSTRCVAGLAITSDGSAVTLSLQDSFTVSPGDQVEIDVVGVENPSTASDAISVSTSSDVVPASASVSLVSPASVSAPVLSTTTEAAGAVDVTYAVSFDTSGSGQMADGEGGVMLQGAPGTRFGGASCDYTVTDVTNTHSVSCVNDLSILGGGRTAAFQMPSGFSVGAGDQLIVQATGVTNPPTGTGDAVSVATSSDPSLVASNSVSTKDASRPGSVALTTSSGSVGASAVTYSVGFTASSTGGLAAGEGTITVLAPAGTQFGNGSWCANVVDTTTNRTSNCDAAEVSADGAAVTVTTGVDVHPSDAVVLTITNVDNPPTSGTPAGEVWTSSDLVPSPLSEPALSGDAISGTVETTSSGSTSAVSGVAVEACPTTGGGACVSAGTTTSTGVFSMAVPPGTYELQATPPPFGGSGSSSSLQAAAYGPVTISAGGSDTGIVINMEPEAAIPSGATVNGSSGVVPSIFWGSASSVTVTGCAGGMGVVVLQGTDSQSGATIVRTVPLTETPPGSGSYSGTVPPLYPIHGNVTVAPFVYCAPLTGVLPYAGPTTGGSEVAIYGEGFTGATAVHFGSAAATDVTVVSDSEVTALTPSGTGTVPVTVTTPSGTTPASALAQFTYLSVTNVGPDTGNTSGGGTVLITGTGFSSVEQVYFGSVRALFSDISSTEIIAYVPPGAAGSTDITVETSGGKSATSPADEFTYSATSPTPTTPQQIPQPPSSPAPTSCSSSAGPSVCSAPPSQSISNAPPLSQGWGGSMPSPGAILSGMSSSATYATTVGDTPPDSSGDWSSVLQWNGDTDWVGNLASIGDNLNSVMDGDVFASDIAEAEDFDGGFGSLSDTLAELMADGPLEGSFLDFALGPVGGIALAAFSMWCNSAQPGGIIGGACAVANVPTDILDFALSKSLNLLQKLWNEYIDPSGTVVDDKGNPIAGATVTILASSSGGQDGPYQSVPSGSVVTQPATNPEVSGSAGQFGWDVIPGWYEIEAAKTGCHAPGSPSEADSVTAPFDVPPPEDGLQIVLTCQSEAPPAVPAVTGLSISSGPASGGTDVSVEGSGFTPSATVSFGSAPATTVTYVSPTDLEATAPEGSGTVDVTVADTGGTSPTGRPDQFTYVAAPTVTGLSSHAGTGAGGSVVEIDGSGFANATNVWFGSSAAINFYVLSNTQVEATSPPGNGTVDVTVTSTDGPSASSSADRFTYASPLSISTSSLPKATVGKAYSETLQASGGVAPYKWELVSGVLPAGLSFSSSGLISGTPSKAETKDLGIQLTDSDTPAEVVTKELSIKVGGNNGPGYWMTTAKGVVYAFGSATALGKVRSVSGAVVGIAAAPGSGGSVSRGYWIATATGHVYGVGTAKDLESTSKPSSPVVGIATDPKGLGYWLVTAAGVVYHYGSAKSYGDDRHKPSSPVVAIAADAAGTGYWLVTETGQVSGFGSAKGDGSVGHISGSAVAIAGDRAGTGYWVATTTGAVYHFGTAASYGGEHHAPTTPVTGLAVAPGGRGYWLVGGKGAVYHFGSATALGSPSGVRSKVVGITGI